MLKIQPIPSPTSNQWKLTLKLLMLLAAPIDSDASPSPQIVMPITNPDATDSTSSQSVTNSPVVKLCDSVPQSGNIVEPLNNDNANTNTSIAENDSVAAEHTVVPGPSLLPPEKMASAGTSHANAD